MQKLGGFPVNSKLTVSTINVFFAGLPRWIPLRFDDGAKIRTTRLPYKCLLHAVYILLRWDFVLLRLAQAILSCMPQAPPCSGGARGGDAASCSCNTADAACDVARRRRSDGGCSTGWQCLAWPCWLCPKHEACTRDTAGNATSCKRFHC